MPYRGWVDTDTMSSLVLPSQRQVVLEWKTSTPVLSFIFGFILLEFITTKDPYVVYYVSLHSSQCPGPDDVYVITVLRRRRDPRSYSSSTCPSSVSTVHLVLEVLSSRAHKSLVLPVTPILPLSLRPINRTGELV